MVLLQSCLNYILHIYAKISVSNAKKMEFKHFPLTMRSLKCISIPIS